MPSSARHLRALDGVRGLAILLVLLDHTAQASPVPVHRLGKAVHDGLLAGRFGVDLFFVLSGFLITGILLDARGEGSTTPAGYYTAFYARRVLRIFPLYYLLVIPLGTWWYWIFAQNIHIALYGWRAIPQTLSHLWSLAVEEQFYLVWPLIVAVLPRRTLRTVCLALIAGAPVLRFVLPPVAAYALTLPRADALAMGALVAILVREQQRAPDERRDRRRADLARVAFYTSLGTFAMLVATDALAVPFGPVSLVVASSLLAILGGAGIYILATSESPRWLCSPVLVSIGMYSYAMYMIHVPIRRLVTDWVSAHVGGTYELLLANFVALLAVSWALAWISWHLLERPILSLKRYVPMPTPTLMPTSGPTEESAEASRMTHEPHRAGSAGAPPPIASHAHYSHQYSGSDRT
jgi:peptidoglycan/LPS O-acetylase OafA/YrhL